MAMPGLDGTSAAHLQFDAFVRHHGDRLLRMAFGLCGDWQHAEDLEQQVLIAMARRWEKIVGDPIAYAYRSLVRANIDRWRVTRRRPELLSEPSIVEAAASDAALRTQVDVSTAVSVEQHAALLHGLHTLPPRQRAVVVLRYLEDLSEARTAEVLGIGVGAVKSSASRGLARLRESMITATEEDAS